MSRIHEALKRAEIELGIGNTMKTSPVSGEPLAAAQKWVAPAAVQITSKPSVLDTVPLDFDRLLAICPHFRWQPRSDANVFETGSDRSGCAEQFRSLRFKLDHLRDSQPLRTLVVTSAAPSEGKTFVVANIAQAVGGQPDRRVLVIDADLRCSTLHKALGAPLAPGLTEYLRGEAEEFKVIQVGEFGSNTNICLIPGGTKVNNPTELLSNGRMKSLLNRVIPAFDWVIIDSPPCLPVADASILADIADGILFVVRAGATSSNLVRKAQQVHKSKLVGVVLNATERKALYRSRQYSY
jgi:protein-tyrosine kinase